MKSIDEIYRAFPDEERERRGGRTGPPSGEGFRVLPIVAFLILVGLLLLSSVVVHPTRCGSAVRADEILMEQIRVALVMYEVRHGAHPPGDGKGSAAMLRALGPLVDANGKARAAIFNPAEEFVDPDGHLLDYHGRRFNYLCPGVHNPGSFDLWSDERLRNWP